MAEKASEREAPISKIDSGGKPMRCHRCEGIMSYEIFYCGDGHLWGWRCLRCGDIVDPIILENRSMKAVSRPRG